MQFHTLLFLFSILSLYSRFTHSRALAPRQSPFPFTCQSTSNNGEPLNEAASNMILGNGNWLCVYPDVATGSCQYDVQTGVLTPESNDPACPPTLSSTSPRKHIVGVPCYMNAREEKKNRAFVRPRRKAWVPGPSRQTAL